MRLSENLHRHFTEHTSYFRGVAMIGAFVSLALSLGPTVSAAELNYPKVSFAPDAVIGLAIVNPGSGSAEVTLTAYGEDGLPLDSVANPVTLTIGPGAQLARTAQELFGPAGNPNAIAWVRGTSPADDLTGFFLYLDSRITFFDGAELAEPYEDLLFPEVRTGTGNATELNLVNPNEEPAQVEMRLYGGDAVITRQFVLPALGAFQRDAGSFFGIAAGIEDTNQSRYVVVNSSLPLSGCSFVRFTSDNLGLSARPLSGGFDRLFFPQLAVLGPFISELTLVNLGTQSVIVNVTAHAADGSLFKPQGGTNPVPVALAPFQAIRKDLQQLFGFQGSETLVGWLEAASTLPTVDGVLSYAVPSIGSRAAVASVAQGSREAVFSHIATVLGYYTGLAILNPGTVTANIRISAAGIDGVSVGTHNLSLGPGNRLSKLIDELIPEAAGMGGGFIWVNSNVPVYSTSLFGRLENGILSNIPPQPAPEAFHPAGAEQSWSLEPPLAVVQPGASLAFSLEGGAATPVVWSVNASPGGSPATGTISSSGIYKGPANTPEQLPVVITASAGVSSAGASLDILDPQVLFSGLGTVQSVAYLAAAKRLFTAELMATSTSGNQSANAQTKESTRIVDNTSGTPVEVARFAAERIPQMVPFDGSDGKEYLLLAGQESGSILRFDPRSRRSVTVVSGLDQPSALVLDFIDGSFLVAEATEVSSFPIALLSKGLSGAGVPDEGEQSGNSRKKLFRAARGRIAVDYCTGNIYASVASEGQVLEYVRETGALRPIATKLRNPGALLGLYRAGVGCPSAFHLLVAQGDADEIVHLVPAEKSARRWLDLPDSADFSLLPAGNPFSRTAVVLIAEGEAPHTRIMIIPVPGIYLRIPANPFRRAPASPCIIQQLTATEAAGIASATLSADGSTVYLSSSENLTGQNPDGNTELFRLFVDQPGLFQLTSARQGHNTDPASISDGRLVVWNSTSRLIEGQPAGWFVYALGAQDNQVRLLPGNPAFGAAVSANGRRIAYFSTSDPLQANFDRSWEIFLYDNETGQLSQATSSSTSHSYAPALSGDGNSLAFISAANLGGLNPFLKPSVFIKDLVRNEYLRVSEITPEISVTTPPPVLNRDGSRLFFSSQMDLTGGNRRLRPAVFYFDRQSRSLVQVSPSAGETAVGSVDASGSILAMLSTADPARLNRDGNREVFLFDANSREVSQVTRSRRAFQSYPILSADGRRLVFLSNADYVGDNADHNSELFLGECEP